MGRRLRGATAGIVVAGCGVAGATALTLTGPSAGAAAGPAPIQVATVAAPPASPAASPEDGAASTTTDRIRLAHLRDETARLEREIRTLEAALAPRAPASTAAVPTSRTATTPPTAGAAPDPAAPQTTAERAGEGGDD